MTTVGHAVGHAVVAETHFERFRRIVGEDAMRFARGMVSRRGADALSEWLVQGVQRPEQLVDDLKGLSWHARVLLAIQSAAIEHEIRQTTDPSMIFDRPLSPGLSKMMHQLDVANRLMPNYSETSDYARAQFTLDWHMALHDLHGRRVYDMAPGLAERLLETELRGLTVDDLKLPYSSIYIAIPPEISGAPARGGGDGEGTPTTGDGGASGGLYIDNAETGRHTLDGAYIAETAFQGVRGWSVLLWGRPNERARSVVDDAMFYFSVKLPPGRSIEDAIEESESRQRSTTDASERYYRGMWRRVFRLVMNAVVYMTWPDAKIEELIGNPDFVRLSEQMKRHPKGSNKYERARSALREINPQRRIYLGRGTPRFEQAPGTPHGPLTVRTLVCGHWRRQAHGPGRVDRKWLWISPFWRGPEGAVESNPRRVLVEGK